MSESATTTDAAADHDNQKKPGGCPMTKGKPLVLAGLATGTLLLAGVASAGFTGIEFRKFVGPCWMDHGYGATGLATYRLYATFDGFGDDGVLAAFGQPGALMVVESSDGVFHNDPLGGITAPEDLTGDGIWSNQWDTYVTIGKTTATDDVTGLSPGFATVTNNLGSNWSDDNVGWYVRPQDEQSIAIHGRVLLAQFVVADGEYVSTTLNLLTRENETFKDLDLYNGPTCCWDGRGECDGVPPCNDQQFEVSSCVECRLVSCCFVDGSCSTRTAQGCVDDGGVAVSDCDECLVSCHGDIDRTGAVDFSDILAILSAWGQVCRPEDLDNSGTVDFGDLLVVLDAWGPCPGATGACCFDDGTCVEAIEGTACVAAGGFFRGHGSTCAADCDVGACCLEESCIVTILEACAAMAGTYRGDDTTCAISCDLSRDDCSGAIVFGEGEYYYSIIGATTDGPDLPSECDEGSGIGFERDVWFRYQASCGGTATASVCDSNFRTRLAIYDDGDCPGPFLACNDDACGVAGTRSEVSFPVETGGVYLIRIGSRTGSIGTGTLVISCEP